MGKEKKKNLGIKTSRYYTKNCTSCNFEYPNWFTNCPKCGAAWNDGKLEKIESSEEIIKKNIKIIVKITEEDFNESIENVNLIFSADQGKSWYSVKMEFISDYFVSEIAEVPDGSIVIYFIEVILENGEKVIENNEGKYFHYKVGEPEGSTKMDAISENKMLNESKDPTQELMPRSYGFPNRNLEASKIISPESKVEEETTIFGKAQTQKDPNLKVCPNCNSKIKKIWSVCPICGKTL